MIALDTNVLVSAFQPEALRHRAADTALRRLLEGGQPWGLPWSVAHEFLAVVTQPRIWVQPASTSRGLSALDNWMGAPGCRLLTEGRGYRRRLGELLAGDDVRGSRIFDARIAATCLVHGVDEIWTADRDFSRFGALRVHNPLLA